MSTKRGRSPRRTSTAPKAKLVNFDGETAEILRSMSERTGISQNALVNQAVVNYASMFTGAASSEPIADWLITAYNSSLLVVHDQWTDVVSKLAGNPEPKES